MTFQIKGLWDIFPMPPIFPHLEFDFECYGYFSKALLDRWRFMYIY